MPRDLKAGDTVLIFDIDKKATVLRPAEGNPPEVLVQAGILQTRIPLTNLRLVQEIQQKKMFRTVTRNVSRAQAPAATEVDVRGMTAEEALMEVDRAIDAAVLSGVGQLTVIHGKAPVCFAVRCRPT